MSDKTDFGPTVSYFEDKVKESDKGKLSITRSDFLGYMDDNGISKETLKKQHELQTDLHGAMIEMAGAALKKDIKEAHKNGDDPSELRREFSTQVYSGKDTIRVQAQKEKRMGPLGLKEGEKPKTELEYGHVTLSCKRKGEIPKGAVGEVAKAIEKAVKDKK